MQNHLREPFFKFKTKFMAEVLETLKDKVAGKFSACKVVFEYGRSKLPSVLFEIVAGDTKDCDNVLITLIAGKNVEKGFIMLDDKMESDLAWLGENFFDKLEDELG